MIFQLARSDFHGLAVQLMVFCLLSSDRQTDSNTQTLHIRMNYCRLELATAILTDIMSTGLFS